MTIQSTNLEMGLYIHMPYSTNKYQGCNLVPPKITRNSILKYMSYIKKHIVFCVVNKDPQIGRCSLRWASGVRMSSMSRVTTLVCKRRARHWSANHSAEPPPGAGNFAGCGNSETSWLRLETIYCSVAETISWRTDISNTIAKPSYHDFVFHRAPSVIRGYHCQTLTLLKEL